MFRKGKSQKTQISNIRKNARKLGSLSKIRVPKGLKPAEVDEVKAYAKWLNDSSKKLFALTNKWSGIGQKQSESLNNELLNLQEAMQHENRQFTMISNIMKNKHDTAKNSINNIR